MSNDALKNQIRELKSSLDQGSLTEDQFINSVADLVQPSAPLADDDYMNSFDNVVEESAVAQEAPQQAPKPAASGGNPGLGEIDGIPVYLRDGDYGPYVQWGTKNQIPDGYPKPKMVSLIEGMTPENMTLDLAKKLLALPRTIGKHPTLNADIIAAPGKFGPYIKCGSETRSLKNTDQLFTISLADAVDLINTPKKPRANR